MRIIGATNMYEMPILISLFIARLMQMIHEEFVRVMEYDEHGVEKMSIDILSDKL